MRLMAADLHIHTAFSPCAEPEMTPEAIVNEAVRRELDMIAVCDHNCAENAQAMIDSAGDRIAVIAGMEITTSEEVHVVGLFPDAESAHQAGRKVAESMPKNDDAADKNDEAAYPGLHVSNGMSAQATRLTLSEAVDLIHEYGGVAVAAHVDRPSYSVFSQLGVWPDDAGFDAIEVSPVAVRESKVEGFAYIGLPIIASSDSHFLSDLGSCRTILKMERDGFDGLVEALQRLVEWRFSGA